ncbi:MAG TPA: sugar phosphate nucleotidyltransferase [Acidobacteriaceae bacterium]|nr:sugar phosphate nucleotidyltransferase [Acidobacteriaceae bacterium]
MTSANNRTAELDATAQAIESDTMTAQEMHESVRSFLIPATASLRQAMEQLERTEEKILFVVDKCHRLAGSLTDGDIRRWILSDGDLRSEVFRACNPSPFTVDIGFDAEQVRAQMLARNINCVPVLAGSREIVRLLFWKDLFLPDIRPETRPRVNVPVVIMAGGRGTRLAPFTNVLPKPLIPVGDRTVIELIIDQFLTWGVDNFHLSVNYKSKLLKSFFEELAPAYSIHYIEEREPRGTASSLRQMYQPSPEDLIVTNCDILIRANLSELVSFHKENNYALTLVASLKDYRIPYGVCELEHGGSLAAIREKPHYSFLVNTGMYVVRRDCLNLIPEDVHFDMTDFIEELKRKGGRIGVFPVGEDAWIDTGEWPEYRKALDLLCRVSERTPHD